MEAHVTLMSPILVPDQKLMSQPLKLHLLGNSKLVLYFLDIEKRHRCYSELIMEQGFACPLDQYNIIGNCDVGGDQGDPEPNTIIDASHKLSKERVVIKVIFKDLAEQIDVQKVPFIAVKESMRHGKFPKNVVKQVEWIEDASYLYIVSAKMRQGDLASFMRNHRIPYLSESELQDPVRCITRAL